MSYDDYLLANPAQNREDVELKEKAHDFVWSTVNPKAHLQLLEDRQKKLETKQQQQHSIQQNDQKSINK